MTRHATDAGTTGTSARHAALEMDATTFRASVIDSSISLLTHWRR
jgi:hypothetical protein